MATWTVDVAAVSTRTIIEEWTLGDSSNSNGLI